MLIRSILGIYMLCLVSLLLYKGVSEGAIGVLRSISKPDMLNSKWAGRGKMSRLSAAEAESFSTTEVFSMAREVSIGSFFIQ